MYADEMASQSVLLEFDARLPRFDVPASRISILRSPTEYHDSLISLVLSAEKRVLLSTLYVGTDSHALWKSLRDALSRRPYLRLTLLADLLRSTRRDPGASITAPTSLELAHRLVQEFGHERVEVRMYHTPRLRGLWKRFFPRRLNEGFGLQHTKICVADDKVLVTGANLANEYFNNRQDRYYLFHDLTLAGYYSRFLDVLSGFCHRLRPRYGNGELPLEAESLLEWPKTNHLIKPLHENDLNELHQIAAQVLEPLIWRDKIDLGGKIVEHSDQIHSDTAVYPLAQLVPLLGRTIDVANQKLSLRCSHEYVLDRLLSVLAECTSWTISTPYLSFSESVQRRLIETAQRDLSSYRREDLTSHPNTRTTSNVLPDSVGRIITAAPEAMSFHGARGLAGYIPRAFSTRVAELAMRTANINVQVLNWHRGVAHHEEGWTFHAKGWWVRGIDKRTKQRGNDGAVVTLVGSSNYGQRSLELDLEADVLIVTTNEGLKRRIEEEEEWILGRTKRVNLDKMAEGSWLEGAMVVILLWVIALLGLSI